MNPKATTLALAFALAATAAGPIWAQPSPPAEGPELVQLRAALKGDKRAYVTSELALTEAEAKRFWPVYENYQRNLDTTVRRTSRLVEEIVSLAGPLTDANAKRLANELVAIDEEESRDRRRMHGRLMRALPAKKALRYLQIENKARAIRIHDIAGVMPLVK